MTSPRTPRRALTTLSTALAAVLLTGCIPTLVSDDPSSPPPTPTSSAPSPTASTPTPDPALERAGRQLTAAEAKSALPPLQKGSRQQSSDVTAYNRKSDPEDCVDVLRLGYQGRHLKEARVVDAAHNWTRGTGDATVGYSTSVESHSRAVGSTMLDRAGSALSGCGTFALYGQDKDGPIDLRLEAQPRSVAPLGEQTFAVRIITTEQINGKPRKFYLDQLVVRIGNNLVEVTQATFDESVDMTRLEELAGDIITELER